MLSKLDKEPYTLPEIRKRDKPYSEEENLVLQKRYLKYLSYKEKGVDIPQNYTFFLFDFGGNGNHGHALGAAVNPEHTHIIYFLEQF